MRIRTSRTGDEGLHKGSHIVLDPGVFGDGANQTTAGLSATANQADMAASKVYVDQEVAAAGGGTDYTLPTASTGIKGGVKAGTTGGTYVIAQDERCHGCCAVRTRQGVNYKGCSITGDNTPNGQLQQGAMIFPPALTPCTSGRNE